MLKPALARGELQCVGASTLNEYRKYIEKDGALERRFQTVMVEPPTVDETVEILKGLRKKYEDHHRVSIPDATLRPRRELSERYITDRFLPDKAIDVIDEAGARARLASQVPPAGSRGAQGRAREGQRREGRRGPRPELRAGRGAPRPGARPAEPDPAQAGRVGAERQTRRPVIDEEAIAFIVSRWTGIPVTRLQEAETARLLRMEDEIHESVVGQDEAITAVSRAIRRSRAGLKDPNRPIGSFIFSGPTGVGKTELARSLAKFLFADAQALIRVDMSEYMEKFSVSRLIGAPPGYVGYEDSRHADQGGAPEALLGGAARRDREGASGRLQHPAPGARRRPPDRQLRPGDRLQEHGRDHDVERRRPGHQQGKTLGFHGGDAKVSFEKMQETVKDEMHKVFNPEFLNRLDDVIVFHPLDEGAHRADRHASCSRKCSAASATRSG